MSKRFVAIWFPYLCTDWLSHARPALKNTSLVLASVQRGKMIVSASNHNARAAGASDGMAIADARAIIPSLEVFNDKPGLIGEILKKIAHYCIRFTPFAAIDPPDGIILDVTGCAHLWGGEQPYLSAIMQRFKKNGYQSRLAIADTIGTAWAIARFGKTSALIAPGQQANALMPLPVAALRLEQDIIQRLQKFGLYQVHQFMYMPRAALRRRFGEQLLHRLDKALGSTEEIIQPVQPAAVFQERLPCLEPICTATGIEIALKRLLEQVCAKLLQEEKGLRKAFFTCYRIDGKTEQVNIGTNRPSHNLNHLFKLFETHLNNIEPAEGIELFILEAPLVEPVPAQQEKIWESSGGIQHTQLAELLDRVAGRIGNNNIHRFLPREHYWPERSIRDATNLLEKPVSAWRTDIRRPTLLLPKPEPIEVIAPIPDYPPKVFRYKDKRHTIKKADGPERIEREWWIEEGTHRDYYCVEDEEGKRYWLFRSGHYHPDKSPEWFIHGFFA